MNIREPATGVSKQFNIPNMQRRIVRVWTTILFLMIAAAFSPSYLGIKGMGGGYAISVVSSFLAFAALLVIGIYVQRAKQFDAILHGDNQLASWQCSASLWQHFVEEDFKAEAAAKRSLYFYVSAIAAVVGLLMFVLTSEALFLLIIVTIIAVLAIPATLVPIMRSRKLRHSGPTVIIGRKGLIVGRMFHYWGHLGARLESVDIEIVNELRVISVQYSYPGRNGRQTETARVPVPDDKEELAGRIVFELKR